jgi:hypothetical protein
MNDDKKQHQALEVVKNWINKVIIGLNFCPFAKRELQRQTVHYSMLSCTSQSEALQHFIDELKHLDTQADIQTTLIVFYVGFTSFDEYLDLVDSANIIIEQGGYAGIYQLASFHPDYCFADEKQDDPANYTNRSPYPILHMLREASIDAVLKHYPSPESIPINNIIKARELGSAYLQQLLK